MGGVLGGFMGGGKGGGGGGGGKTTVQQNTEPWSAQKPYLEEMFKDAQNLYQTTGMAPAYYSGSTVAGQDPYTAQAISRQADRALSGSLPVGAAQDQLAGTLQGGYLTGNPFAGGETSPDFLSQYAKESGNPSFLSQYAKESGNPSFLSQYAKESGNPSFLSQYQADSGNPAMLSAWNSGSNKALADAVSRAQNQTLANVSGSFSQAGRYGSGAHAASANDAAGNIAARMYNDAYNQDQDRSLQSWSDDQNRRLDAYEQTQNRGLAGWQAGQQNRLDAYNQAQNRNLTGWQTDQQNRLDAWNSGLNRELSAYNAERENMMRAAGLSPSLAEQDYRDIAALSEAGTARENHAQNLINADIDRYNYNAGRDLTNLQNYGAMISGGYGLSGSSTNTGNAAKSNPLGGLLSGGLSGAGMGYLLGGQTGGLYGGGIGGLLGLF